MPARLHAGAPAGLALKQLKLPSFCRNASGPIVVAIEGPNGAGKTTLTRGLSRRLKAARCLGTDEAWFAEQFKTRMIRDADWFASAMFFLSGCFEQMRLLQQKDNPLVIMDRCLWSTLAVHGAEDLSRLQALLAMLRPIASEIPVPHLTLVLEASFATCRSRIAKKKSARARALDRLTANPKFHAREMDFYGWLGAQAPGVIFLCVDKANEKEVADKAVALIKGGL
jgi:thymidylate kinase